jgi:hypothetical protein
MEIVALSLLLMSPRLQVIEFVPVQDPRLGVAETSVTLAGKVSVTVTPVAVRGPLFVTYNEYPTLLPTGTVAGVPHFTIETSEPDEPAAVVLATNASPTKFWPLPPKAGCAGFISGKSVDTVEPVT